MFNLFDVTVGCNTLGEKPRNATELEVKSYLVWLASRAGIAIPSNATFGADGIHAGKELLLAMPGYADQPRAMLEVLDDDGNVIRSTPIAVDTRGNMTLTKAQVQQATGLKPVRQPKRRASIAVAEIKPASIRPVEAPQSASPEIRPSDAERAPVESQRQPEPMPDASAALVARLEVLERQVATLSRLATPTAKPVRTAAHERAVRRAWAERRARRLAMAIAEDHMRMRETMQGELQRATDAAASWRASSGQHFNEVLQVTHRREHASRRARRMIGKARAGEMFQRQRADVLHAQLVALRAAMADPSQPERASDINRLMTERDQLRNACSALEQRCGTMQTALEQVADAVETWSSRAIRAEAELRAAPPIAA